MRQDYETRIIEWALERGLLSEDNARNQFIKLTEEVGELADALLKDDYPKIVDAVGDIEVVLTILKEQLNLGQTFPLSEAWEQIKNRTGKTENGIFIKDGK